MGAQKKGRGCIMGRSLFERVIGTNLVLRLIAPDDADYVQNLRTDPKYNLHLSKVTGTANDQRRWIESYKAREADGHELYYVIERRDGVRCGLVRLYEIGAESCTWGSFILDAHKPQKAALESLYLIFQIVFEFLSLRRTVFEARKRNEIALTLYRRFGAKQVKEDAENIYFVYEREQFERDRAKFRKVFATVSKT
jgi:RimJ/RimL family protein N-acetyltransferase